METDTSLHQDEPIVLLRDPRNPDSRYMVSHGGTNPLHGDIRKILVLMRVREMATPIYLVVESISSWPMPTPEMVSSAIYYHQQHSCPTNFIRVPLIARLGDFDPHDLFEVLDAVWQTDEYVATDDDPNERSRYLAAVFPQLLADVSAEEHDHVGADGCPLRFVGGPCHGAPVQYASRSFLASRIEIASDPTGVYRYVESTRQYHWTPVRAAADSPRTAS